jgi:hypothetical protein
VKNKSLIEKGFPKPNQKKFFGKGYSKHLNGIKVCETDKSKPNQKKFKWGISFTLWKYQNQPKIFFFNLNNLFKTPYLRTPPPWDIDP